MKKKLIAFISIFLFAFFALEGLFAQDNVPPPHLPQERRGFPHGRRMPPANEMQPQSFFVKKIHYTLKDNILEIDIHFNGPVNPKTIENRPFLDRRRENIESITYTYNRTADRVKIVVVLKTPPDRENFSFSLEGVESFGKGPLHKQFFENIEPSKIYEYEEDGTWKEY